MSTPRVAMFLGAGASKHFRAPLTKEILPEIMRRLATGSLFEKAHENQALQRLLRKLLPGIESLQPKEQEHVLITEILSLVDYMLLSAFVPAPRARADELQEGRMLLERAILDATTTCRYDRSHSTTVPDRLRELARWMYLVGQESSLALVSTNYDELIESAFYWSFMDRTGDRPFDIVNTSVNFGMSWRDTNGSIFHPPQNYRHSILKLHGSVDWVKCDLCGWIVCNDDFFFSTAPNHYAFLTAHDGKDTCTCGHSPLRPVIIAPSLVRDIRDINILDVWKAAFEELRTADYWYMIGYSLPIDDYAIRSMLMRALASRGLQRQPSIEVYQWGTDEVTSARYRAFFGPNCIYHTTGMQGFLDDVVKKNMFLTRPSAVASAT
jgi:NAD-dependent SIR2 family protein deacetylase